MHVNKRIMFENDKPQWKDVHSLDIGGEHPGVVVHDVASRLRSKSHIIVFANEKGGVGKSTLAFHTAVALSHAGAKVAAIDLDQHQATLSRALTNREATARLLKIALPCPRFLTLSQHSGAFLAQEIARINNGCSHVIIDVAGVDSPIARRAIAMADTLVTPVSSSFVDLDLLGQFDSTTLKFKRLGHFARVVAALQEARETYNLPRADWVVVQNRSRRPISNNDARCVEALQGLSRKAGFRIGHGLGDRVAYRELFLHGLTHLDLKQLPGLSKVKAFALSEVEQMVTGLFRPASKREPVKPAAIGKSPMRPLHQTEDAAVAA